MGLFAVRDCADEAPTIDGFVRMYTGAHGDEHAYSTAEKNVLGTYHMVSAARCATITSETSGAAGFVIDRDMGDCHVLSALEMADSLTGNVASYECSGGCSGTGAGSDGDGTDGGEGGDGGDGGDDTDEEDHKDLVREQLG